MSSDDDDAPPLLIDTTDLDVEEKTAGPPVPVTIVTGYLGSGKSTLLHDLTQRNRGLRIAVVLNEFGQTSDIERSISVRNRDVNGIEVEQWVELDNGCMCCTAKDAGVSAIENLMKRQGRFDHIIIETSGVADPAPIANMFWLDQALMASVYLNGVVTVVDSRTILRSLADEKSLASVQIACADVLILNKAETVTSDEMSAVSAQISAINGAATQFPCSFGHLTNPDEILNLNEYSGTHTLSFADVHPTPSHIHNHLSTVVLELDSRCLSTAQELAEFEHQLQTLLWTKQINNQKIEVHRAKGKLQCMLTTTPQTKIVQGVREVYEITDVEYEPDGECKLVLIGQGLSATKPDLEAAFSARKRG